MSQPKRYTTNVGYGHEEDDGEFVLWDDYAALKAENERLRSGSFVTAVPSEQYERVIKAGDAMDDYLKRQDGTTNGMLPCREAWLAAKEGRDAK